MHIVTVILVLLLAVVVSAFAARLLPWRIPLPLLQIVLGAVLSFAGFEVEFDPELFLLLFIPPLLFLDGWRIPKGAFFRDWKPILALATGLVVFTVIGMGFFIHWLIPTVPLAVAFALAAILSPTDPVAVSAMTANAPLPSRLTHILEGESLLNDATGLVCFSFAVTAALTGTFSLLDAGRAFVVVAGGGVLAGLGVTWLIGILGRVLVRRTGEDPAIQSLVSLLMPFAAYLVAEQLQVSGILAAAVAGIAMHYGELAGQSLAATRMQRNALWSTVQTALNGIIFLLLGEQLPDMLAGLPAIAAAGAAGSAWHLLLYLVAITVGLAALRFLWVWAALQMTLYRHGRWQAADLARLRVVAVAATAGVRGAITLAGILTLPLLMPDGAAFPGRDVAIFLAMGVILLSLLGASAGLPILARGLAADLPQPRHGAKEGMARIAAAEAAIRQIEAIVALPLDDPEAAAFRAEGSMRLLDVYQRRLQYGDPSGEDTVDMQRLAAAERELRLQALAAEREELYRLRRTRAIDDGLHSHLVREVDLMEASLLEARLMAEAEP